MNDEQVLIKAVRVIANAKYNQGWDVVVECMTDGDILEVLSNCQFDLPKAIASIQSWVDEHSDYADEIKSTAF